MAPQTELIDETGRVVFRGTQSPGGGSIPGALYQVIRDVSYTDFIPDGGLGPGLSNVFYELAADEVLLAGGLQVTKEFDDSAAPTFGVVDETNTLNLIVPTGGGFNTSVGPGVTTGTAGLVALVDQSTDGTWAKALQPHIPESAPVGLICFNANGNGWVGDGTKGILRVRLWLAKGSAS